MVIPPKAVLQSEHTMKFTLQHAMKRRKFEPFFDERLSIGYKKEKKIGSKKIFISRLASFV